MATANGTHKPIIFIFAGQGSQWHGMGQLSYAQNHVFRQTVDDLDRVLSGLGRIAPLWKLSDAFDGSKKASQLPTGASWSVTTTTALQLAQLHMLASMDSHPDYVLGHSFGEVPAAYACGMLELKEAITIAYRSSYVLEQMSGPGEMLVCDMDFATATKEVETLGLHQEAMQEQGIKEVHVPEKEAESTSRIPSTPDKSEVRDCHEQHSYPTGWRLWVIVTALVLSSLCYALDETILATAVPSITNEFQAVGDIGWYGSAYLAACCVCQPIFGNLYRAFSVKWVFLSAAVIFEIGNVVAGSAQSSSAVIAGRVVTGAGCAGLDAGTWLIISQIVPLHRRPVYISAIGSIYSVAAIVGPILGGVLTQYASWRWVFYINLPLGGITFLLLLLAYDRESMDRQKEKEWKQLLSGVVFASAALFGLAIVSLLLALEYGGTYQWKDRRTIAFLVVFAVAFLGFLATQLAWQEKGIVPLRLLKQRSIAAGLWFSFCSGASSTTLIYYLPLWFQVVKGFSSTRSGILTIPFLLGFVVFALLAGAIVTRIGYYVPCMLASTILLSVGSGMLSTLSVNSGQALYVVYQILYAAGSGLGNNQPLLAVQTVLSADDIAVGTSTVALGQTLGGAIFVAVSQSVFSQRLVGNLRAAGANINTQQVRETGATALGSNPLLSDIPHKEILTAYNDAIIMTFIVSVSASAATIAGSLAMEWRTVRSSQTKTEDASGAG
ncbi:MFS transporter, partial [Aureobasidium melanogenum]